MTKTIIDTDEEDELFNAIEANMLPSILVSQFLTIPQPNVCVLLDVGTMPGPNSIYHLWKAFDIHSNVGGA